MKFAALKYVRTVNLGDEIQTLAAIQFLPHVDAWVDREQLNHFTSDDVHKIILNGWFLHRPERWPPSQFLRPLILSFHLTRELHTGFNLNNLAPAGTVLGAEGVRYLKAHEPIGARDLDTLRQLEAAGVSAYFSGCLTLTLRVPDPPARRDEICAVDVSDKAFAHLVAASEVPVMRLSHLDDTRLGEARFERAAWLLRRYAAAKAVVTERLHCALPCLALGTPVLFVETAADSYRFNGLRELLHSCSQQDLLEGRARYDVNTPPRNKDGWRNLREQLETRCKDYVVRHDAC